MGINTVAMEEDDQEIFSEFGAARLEALARRVLTIAHDVQIMEEREKRRDDRLDGINELTKRNEAAISLVRNKLAADLTDQDWATLRAIIDGHKYRDKTWKWVIRWAGYISAIAVASAAIHNEVSIADIISLFTRRPG